MSKPLTIYEAPVQLTISQIRAYQDWLTQPHDYERVAREFPTLEQWAAQNPYPHETVLTETQLTWREELAVLGMTLVSLGIFALAIVGAFHLLRVWTR